MLHPLTLVLALFLVSLVSMSAYPETIKDNNLRYGDTPTDMKNGLIRIRRIRLEGDPLFPKYGITEKFLQKRINQVYSHMGKSLSMASINKIADKNSVLYKVPPTGASGISTAIFADSVLIPLNILGSIIGVFPVAIRTIIVSPIALPNPIIMAAKIPD